jgi:glutathionylspermidine synthase
MRRIKLAERPDWKETAEKVGFVFHTIDGERYWDETACYAFTLRQVEQDIEDPTTLIHEMAMDLVGEVVRSDSLMARLAIPEKHRDWVANSWKKADPHLYGRMDFSYNGTSPAKLFELNYDTPTSLYEAAYFQWLWLEQMRASGALPRSADQYNSIQETLILAFATLAKERRLQGPLHLAAVRGAREDQATVDYLQDCAVQAGLKTIRIDVEDIGMSTDGRYTNMDDDVIQTLFKLYPLEMMFTDEAEKFLESSRIQLIEPAWKAILSNKAMLPLLWERHRGHPNLLESYFAEPGQSVGEGWVKKPLFSREGANVEMHLEGGEKVTSDGPYTDSPYIVQKAAPLPKFEGGYPLIGSWVVADQACGMGIREDATLITRDTSRFMPHIILD